MKPILSVAMRFWGGLILSTALMIGMILLFTLATGQGREWEPLAAFMISFVAVPLVMLVNCWVLFVSWRSKTLLVLASQVVPLFLVTAILLSVHGYGRLHDVGVILLAPFFSLGQGIGLFPLLAFCLWLTVMAAVLYLAHRRSQVVRHHSVE